MLIDLLMDRCQLLQPDSMLLSVSCSMLQMIPISHSGAIGQHNPHSTGSCM